MDYVKLGKTAQEVSRIGLGGLAFGGHYGSIEKIDIIRTIHAAIDLGVTYFDTSPTYGDGKAELLLAEALGSHLDRVFIASKIGAGIISDLGIWRSNDRATIIKRVEGTLQRLGRDHIDLYEIYGPDPHTPVSETLETLLELRAEGKIRYIGTCDTDIPRLRECLRYGRVEAVQASYNLLNRSIEEELIPFCRATGMAIVACEPFLCGLLHGELHKNSVFDMTDLRVRDRRFRGERYRNNVETVNRLRRVAEQEGLTLSQLALGWMIQNSAIQVVLCGARSPQQIRQIVASAGTPIAPDASLWVDQTIGMKMFEQPA